MRFQEEPVIGHHVSAEIVTPDSPLDQALDEAMEKHGIPRRDNRRVEIEVGDVDWEDTMEVSIDIRTFKKMTEWFEEEV